MSFKTVSLRAWCVTLALAACMLTGAVSAGALALPGPLAPKVTIGGAVAAPASYSVAQLEALPQTTATVSGQTLSGVSLEALVNAAQPVLPNAKNALLRVTIAVADASGRSTTIALGELDPNFGNHPAILALSSSGFDLRDGPELIVPGDVNLSGRFLARVTRITVGVQSPAPTTPPGAGGITVHDGGSAIALSASRLAALPAQSLTVTFKAGSSPQTHTEHGPTLDTVLAAAGLRPASIAWVAGVGDDGYVATVTPLEAEVGGRPLLISLVEDGVAQAQPRLVVDGDVKGGRYVSGLVDLSTGEPQPPWAILLDGIR